MKDQWHEVKKNISLFKLEFQEFVNITPLTAASKKQLNKSLTQFRIVTEKVNEYDDIVSPLSSITVDMPTEQKDFLSMWNYWKAYLNEQHGIVMRSRREKICLEHMAEICDKDWTKATEWLRYAISKNYRNFFKVEVTKDGTKKVMNEDDPDLHM